MMFNSQRMSRMTAVQSPIISRVRDLMVAHPGTISLSQGTVYYHPPPAAIASVSEFLAHRDHHKYQELLGIPPLIEAITAKLQEDNGIEISDRLAIAITAGSNMGFLNAIFAITEPGDEIILQLPYYFNHEMTIMMANCCPVVVETDENYQLDLDAIAQAITAKTKAIVTISPNNPTGAVYPKEDLQAVNQLCRHHGIYHISDEAYEYFTYDGIKHCSPGSFPDSDDYTISLYSFSKAYGLASWRIGYMVMPLHLLSAVEKVQDVNLICPPVISQYAALAAVQSGKSYCQEQIQAIASVRKSILSSLQTLSGSCTIGPANGSLYFFLKINTNLDSFELVKRLIQKYQVAVLPGTTFGLQKDSYLRVAYGGLPPETILAGIDRLVQGLSTLLSE